MNDFTLAIGLAALVVASTIIMVHLVYFQGRPKRRVFIVHALIELGPKFIGYVSVKTFARDCDEEAVLDYFTEEVHKAYPEAKAIEVETYEINISWFFEV